MAYHWLEQKAGGNSHLSCRAEFNGHEEAKRLTHLVYLLANLLLEEANNLHVNGHTTITRDKLSEQVCARMERESGEYKHEPVDISGSCRNSFPYCRERGTLPASHLPPPSQPSDSSNYGVHSSPLGRQHPLLTAMSLPPPPENQRTALRLPPMGLIPLFQ